MKARVQGLLQRIDAFSIREKLIVMVTLIIASYALWDTALMEPLKKERAKLNERITPKQVRNTQLAAQIDNMVTEHRHDPNQELRSRLQQLQREVELLDQRLHERTVDLITPAEMSKVLEALLAGEVQLLGLHSLEATPMIQEEEKKNRMLSFFGEESKAPNIYRHTLVLTFRASYLDALAYLRALSELPWLFSWERLALEVTEHPWCRVELTAHTLSLSEEWIGG